MSSRHTIVDVTYDDPRTGDRIRERRVQEVPFEEIDEIRNRELAIVRAPPIVSQELTKPRYADDEYQVERNYRRVRERAPDPGYLVPYDRNRDNGYYDRRDRRGREAAAYDSEASESDSSSERRRRRRHRRARSERDADRRSSTSARAKSEHSDDDDLMFYSGKKRCDGNFVERNFDSSYDGIIAGVAGAAIGVVTARSFADDKKNKVLQTLGSAVLGAAAFNLAENKYSVYTKEREVKRERKEEAAVHARQQRD